MSGVDPSRDGLAAEIARLRGCLNDLVSIVTLPAARTGSDAPQIVNTLINALCTMLPLAVVFVRLHDPDGGPPVEIARVAEPAAVTAITPDIGAALDRTLGSDPVAWPRGARVTIGGLPVAVASFPIRLEGDLGIMVAGSARTDFPEREERLLLEVAANQAAINLRQARLLADQTRVATALDERVERRTRELASANAELTKEVAERRRAETALRDSERESRLIVDSIPGLVALLTATGDVDLVNRQLLEYFGQPLEELRRWGRNGTVHPDDLPHVIDVFTRAIGSGTPYEIVQRLRRADGVYRWIRNSGVPVHDPSGQIVRWCVLLTDVDERQRAEEALRRSEAFLIEGQQLARLGNFSWRVAARHIEWSDELYRIFGFAPGTLVTLDRIATRVHPEDLPLLHDMIARAERGDGDFEYAHRLVMPDGAIKHLHLVAHAVRDEDGRLEYIGAVQDVTQRRVSEEALSQARAELTRVARAMSLGTLTASIAHEVNQPLSGIITNANTCLRMLATAPPDIEGARETVRRTIRDGNRAAEVIARLRALYSKKDFSAEALDVNDAAREVIALSLSELQGHRVLLRSELAEGLPAVIGDRVQIQQVVLNLLRNACDAMAGVEDRPRQIVISTEHDGRPGGVRLTVRDAGVGLDHQIKDKLFDAFFTTKADGMGIGLSVSRSIIERHHGRLWAEANDGPGAAFSFFIPREGTPAG